MLADEDLKCPLIFSSYIGDGKSVESLLFSGDWPQESLDRGLMYATRCGWVDAMLSYFIDGRADPNYKLSLGTQHSALMGHAEAVSLSLANHCSYRNLRSQYVWLAHMDRIETLQVLLGYDSFGVLTDSVFLAAARGLSENVLHLMLREEWQIKSPDVVKTLIAIKKLHHLIPRVILEHGAPVDGEALNNRHVVECKATQKIIRDANVKKRWRQVRAVVRIWHFWREWIMDYYCPGNENYPTGNGFLRSQEKFLALIGSQST